MFLYSNLSNRVLFSDMLCMKTYPLELRHRVIRAVDNRIGTKKEIAEIYDEVSIEPKKFEELKAAIRNS